MNTKKESRMNKLSQAMRENLLRRKKTQSKKEKQVKTSSLFYVFLLLLTSCQVNKINHGYIIPDDELHELKSRTTTKNQVVKLLGVPTAEENGDYIYIGQKYQQKLFLLPKLNQQKIVQIRFSKNDTISQIKLYDASTAHDLKYDSDETKFKVKNISLFKQIISSVGTFNSDAKRAAN